MRALVVMVALLACACSAGTRSPAGAVRALSEAAADGDRAEVWRLLGPRTRARLEADARRVAELSGRRQVSPEEMLAVGWYPPTIHAADVRELERNGDAATVEVVGRGGERERVSCVREGGAWKVELP